MGGFIRRCKDLDRRPYHILVALAGKAAVELYYSETCGFGMIDVSTNRFPDTSENMNARKDAVVHAELERYMLKCREILLKNKDFLERATEMLPEKENLLYSDIKALRENMNVAEIAV